jgi:ubiquinone/menaquinone biosynthesis C-methylase UbiE
MSVTSAVATPYILDNAMDHAHVRLTRLEAVYDPGTFRVFDTIGVGTGWSCLEVGAGAGSVAAWLSDRVGPTGYILATDINPRFLQGLAETRSNLGVRTHNIVTDDLPPAAFDLIHTRLVLEHISEREQALARMVEALAPGGWLVVESIDFGAEAPDPTVNAAYLDLFDRLHTARISLLADGGFDLTFARGLARNLRSRGLTDVTTEGRAYTWSGGSTGTSSTEVWRLSIEQMREAFVRGGYLREIEIKAILTMVSDPEFAGTSPLVMAAWGRRPA